MDWKTAGEIILILVLGGYLFRQRLKGKGMAILQDLMPEVSAFMLELATDVISLEKDTDPYLAKQHQKQKRAKVIKYIQNLVELKLIKFSNKVGIPLLYEKMVLKYIITEKTIGLYVDYVYGKIKSEITRVEEKVFTDKFKEIQRVKSTLDTMKDIVGKVVDTAIDMDYFEQKDLIGNADLTKIKNVSQEVINYMKDEVKPESHDDIAGTLTSVLKNSLNILKSTREEAVIVDE